MNPRRLKLLDAIARAQDATGEAMMLALELAQEGDDVESARTPPNVIREADKTGPRLPYKATTAGEERQKPTAYSFTSFTGERALAHVKKAYEEARTETGRQHVVGLMRRLADHGLFSSEDVAEYLNPPRRRR